MDVVIQVIFLITAGLIVGAATMVVSVRNIIHAALWLISTFFGIGMLYMLLEAPFLAVSQVLVYVGAVSILVLFAIMLTHHITAEGDRLLYERWWVALVICATLFGAILVPTLWKQRWTPVTPPPVTGATGEAVTLGGPVELGVAFMQEYFIPFQVAGVLLLVALVGAIVIAYEERSRRRRVLTLAEEWEQRKAQQSMRGRPPEPQVVNVEVSE